ncbi:MAG TPA: hypothetical protein VE034_01060 [Burkholderiales bacterium]|nr:hypothetical protein [Burkholderiales bacterium]
MNGWKTCLGGLSALAIVVVPSFPRAQEPAKAPTYPHVVTGEDLAAHFQGNWSVNGATSKATPVTFFNNSDGTVRIRGHNTSRVPDGFGNRQVKAAQNQVCLDFTTTSWRGATGCYRLVETEPKAYSLRSVKGSYRIEYRR